MLTRLSQLAVAFLRIRGPGRCKCLIRKGPSCHNACRGDFGPCAVGAVSRLGACFCAATDATKMARATTTANGGPIFSKPTMGRCCVTVPPAAREFAIVLIADRGDHMRRWVRYPPSRHTVLLPPIRADRSTSGQRCRHQGLRSCTSHRPSISRPAADTPPSHQACSVALIGSPKTSGVHSTSSCSASKPMAAYE